MCMSFAIGMQQTTSFSILMLLCLCSIKLQWKPIQNLALGCVHEFLMMMSAEPQRP